MRCSAPTRSGRCSRRNDGGASPERDRAWIRWSASPSGDHGGGSPRGGTRSTSLLPQVPQGSPRPPTVNQQLVQRTTKPGLDCPTLRCLQQGRSGDTTRPARSSSGSRRTCLTGYAVVPGPPARKYAVGGSRLRGGDCPGLPGGMDEQAPGAFTVWARPGLPSSHSVESALSFPLQIVGLPSKAGGSATGIAREKERRRGRWSRWPPRRRNRPGA